MQPVLGCQVATEALASQNILTNERDQGGMLGGMIEGIARPDALQNKPGCLGDDLGVARLTTAEGAGVGGSQFVAQGVGQHLGWIEHGLSPLPSTLICYRSIR